MHPLLALAVAASCAGHELTNQRRDAESVRRADSAWTVAYVHGDTAFMRCLLTPDFTNYTLTGTYDRDGELAKAARTGDPAKPVPPLPHIDVQLHGASAVATWIANGRRGIDVYAFVDGRWRAYLAADVKLVQQP
jgi:hypothetical protein